jgi:hypothetical protein
MRVQEPYCRRTYSSAKKNRHAHLRPGSAVKSLFDGLPPADAERWRQLTTRTHGSIVLV